MDTSERNAVQTILGMRVSEIMAALGMTRAEAMATLAAARRADLADRCAELAQVGA